MHSHRRPFPLVLALALVLVQDQPARAEDLLSPVITSAVPDAANGVFIVRGRRFGTAPPRVTLNLIELPVVTSGPREIIVRLSPDTPAASYLLVVYRDGGPSFGTFIVAIGGTGPAGPRGAEGPDDARGDGNTEPDIVIGGGSVALRAERSGTGVGRTYTITATATDRAGNTTRGIGVGCAT